MLRRGAAAFLLALEFLTIVRLRRAASVDGPTLGMSLGWFPVIGLLIGLTLAGVDRLGRGLFPLSVATALVLTAGVILTGALHLDGLADSADGLFGGHTPERRLEIMKDSRTGSFGVVAVALVLLLQFAALGSLTGEVRWRTLIVAPMLGRMAMVAAVICFPYARATGLGRLYRDHATVGVVPVAIALIVAAGVMEGLMLALLALLAFAVALSVGTFATRRLGGLTGDAYGAVGVVAETAVLMAASAIGKSWPSDAWFG